MDKLLETVALSDIAAALQQAGFRAEPGKLPDGSEVLRSATGGVEFTVRVGNAGPKSVLDFAFAAPFRVVEPVLKAAPGEWNPIKRFSRLYEREGLLVLELDVLVAGGVGPQYLRAYVEIWNRLVNDLLLYLRAATQKQAAAVEPAGEA